MSEENRDELTGLVDTTEREWQAYCAGYDQGYEGRKAEQEHGTVELIPYVGDSPIAVAKCRHGDYERMFKGGSIERARKALDEHFAAKHPAEDFDARMEKGEPVELNVSLDRQAGG